MTDKTPLDTAHAAMELASDDSSARLRFFERLADSELFLLLQSEAVGETITPEVFEVEGRKYALIFDREERLAEFVDGSAHHAAMSGRVVAAMLAGKGIGLGLNLGVAPSSILLPAEALVWLVNMLDSTPEEVTEQPVSIAPPKDIPKALLTALDVKLATAGGLAKSAYLVTVVYENKRQSNLVAVIDAAPAAQKALAKAVSEVIGFSAIEDGELDVAFFSTDDPICRKLEKVGLRFDLPERKKPIHEPTAPGRDPKNPPILR